MKQQTLIYGFVVFLYILVSASADTTTDNITVNNTAAVISQIFTFNQSAMQTSYFTYSENLSVRANVTDLNGVSDLDKVKISILTFNKTVLVNNATMTNISQITNGFTYEYNYTLNRTSYPGNYTITILANDSANAVSTNSTDIRVKLTLYALVPSYDSCANQEIQLWNTSADTVSETHLSSNMTNSNCQIIYSYPFSKYHIWHHPTTAYSVFWNYLFTRNAYQEIDITGGSLGGGGTGGTGGGTTTYTPTTVITSPEQSFEDFVFDLRISSFIHQGGQLYSEVTLKNQVLKFGDITLQYLIKNATSIFNSVSEQIYVKPYNVNLSEGDNCSTVLCPHSHVMAMLQECTEDLFLKVVAMSLPNSQNLSHKIAEAEVQVCAAAKPLEVTPETTTTTIEGEQAAEDNSALIIGGVTITLLVAGMFMFGDKFFSSNSN